MNYRPLLAVALLAVGCASLSERSSKTGVDPQENLPSEKQVAVDPTWSSASDPADVSTYVLDLRDELSQSQIDSLAVRYGLTLRANSAYSSGHDNVELFETSKGEGDERVQRLLSDPDVEALEPNLRVHAYFTPNDPLYSEKQWHLDRVGAPRAWEFGCGRGVKVAVIDTGVACFDNGPFSRGTDLDRTRCEGGYDFVNKRQEASDDQGHGTHVAGTIAQSTHNGKGAAGLAYCATILPIKVLSENGSGTLADVAEGIRFAVDEGAQIINLSLGGPYPSRVIHNAIKYALSHRVLVVAAAGNSGKSVGYPAGYPGVMAISATDRNDRVAWFSSRGPEVVLAAPGVQVTQQTVCQGGKNHCELFGTFNGTSMASPHVAGAAAMIMSLGITDPKAVRTLLERSAAPKGEPEKYGSGLLDVGRAISSAALQRMVARVGLAALFMALVFARKRGASLSWARFVLGLGFATLGALPFLPWVGAVSRFPSSRVAIELLSRPFADWSTTLGGQYVLPFAWPLWTIVLAGLTFSIRRFRPVLGGFAVGQSAVAAHALLFSTSVMAWPVSVLLFCGIPVQLWIARVSLSK